jgi:hypothetical protein
MQQISQSAKNASISVESANGVQPTGSLATSLVAERPVALRQSSPTSRDFALVITA